MHAFTERFSERLTERVVTHSLGEWKGREWKGMENNRVAASHHDVALVTRESTDAMMALRADLDDLPDVMCDSPFADDDCQQVAHLITRTCATKLTPLCLECWDLLDWNIGECETHDRTETRDEHFTIVQVLR